MGAAAMRQGLMESEEINVSGALSRQGSKGQEASNSLSDLKWVLLTVIQLY